MSTHDPQRPAIIVYEYGIVLDCFERTGASTSDATATTELAMGLVSVVQSQKRFRKRFRKYLHLIFYHIQVCSANGLMIWTWSGSSSDKCVMVECLHSDSIALGVTQYRRFKNLSRGTLEHGKI